MKLGYAIALGVLFMCLASTAEAKLGPIGTGLSKFSASPGAIPGSGNADRPGTATTQPQCICGGKDKTAPGQIGGGWGNTGATKRDSCGRC